MRLGILLATLLIGACGNAVGSDRTDFPEEDKILLAEQNTVEPEIDDRKVAEPDAFSEMEITLIEHEVSSWGRRLMNISLAADRTAGVQKFEFKTEKLLQDDSYRLTKSEYRKAAAALEPLRAKAGGKIDCDNMPTDGPYGSFTWNSTDSVNIYMPCLQNEEFTKFDKAIDDFIAAIQHAKAAPRHDRD